jgi:hypothetical protein
MSEQDTITRKSNLITRCYLGFSKIDHSKKILVIHIAKTAGTSLRRMLEREYGAKHIYPGSFYLKQFDRGSYPMGSQMLRDYSVIPPHKVLVGHFTAAMADMVPTPYQTATFLREPIQRSLSMLSHFSHKLHIPVATLLENEQFMADNIADFQTRIMGADSVCDPHAVGTVDDGALARSLGRLESLDFVGITEQFPESCRRFDSLFETRISKSIQRINVLRPEGNELAEHISRIESLVQRDQVLYDAALARFNIQ